MKTKFLSLMLIMVSCICLMSCSDDDDAKFDYPLETLYGTWDGTYVYSGGKWIDLSSWAYEDLRFSITFYSDGRYYGSGVFGNGGGTYKAKGNTITTYIDGEVYLCYEIISLTEKNTEVLIRDNSGDSMKVRAKKRN